MHMISPLHEEKTTTQAQSLRSLWGATQALRLRTPGREARGEAAVPAGVTPEAAGLLRPPIIGSGKVWNSLCQKQNCLRL